MKKFVSRSVVLLGFALALPLSSQAQLYSDLVLEDNPLVYWRFSNDLTDSAGDLELNPAASPQFVEGPFAEGQAFSSDGGQAWAAGFGIIDLISLQNFSYEFWIKPQGLEEGDYILQRAAGGTGSGQNSLIYTNGGIQFINTGAGDLLDVPFVELKAESDEWVHFALVHDYDGISMKIYLDGELAFEGEAILEPLIGTQDFELYIGAWRGDPEGTVMNASIDEVAIYDAALSADQIQAHVSAGSPADYAAAVKADEPLSYWRFESNFTDDMGLYNLLPSGVQFVEGPGGAPNRALYGRITTAEGEKLYTGIESFTYELWFNPIFESSQSYVFYRNPSSAQQHAVIYAYNPNALEFFALDGGARPLYEIPNAVDEWHYCVMLNDVPNQKFSIYIN
ncbi:MAG: LamG domain-containing protein, partial [Candidatus Hinthialibacter sp.]